MYIVFYEQQSYCGNPLESSLNIGDNSVGGSKDFNGSA